MYNDTVTVFNRYVDSFGNTIWHPHVISEANLIVDKSVIASKYGSQSNDNAVLNLKYSYLENAIIVGNKQFLFPKEWEKQTNDRLSETITFNSGNEFDFFILGNYFSQDPIFDEYGTFFDEMQKEYDNVFVITSVSKYDVIPHFEILGR